MRKVIIFDFYNTLYNPKTGRLFRGSISLLKKLSNRYRLILVTTYSSERKKQIQNLRIMQFFNPTVICRIKTMLVYQKIISQFQSYLIIGDNLEEEIAIGRKLSVDTLVVDPSLENPILTIKKYINI